MKRTLFRCMNSIFLLLFVFITTPILSGGTPVWKDFQESKKFRELEVQCFKDFEELDLEELLAIRVNPENEKLQGKDKTSPVVASEDFDDFEELELADMLDVEVVSAGKRPQKISEAPAAIYVITDEDISHSGATNIPDVLRMVPGLDVMEITATDFAVNARGFNKPGCNTMLVLINGRSVYWGFLGLTIWDSFPIVLEEIDRIEVIKGPGSSLYGANAFSGVINILTKAPDDLGSGTSVSAGYGSLDNFATSLIHAGERKNLSYKVSLGWEGTNQWQDRDTKEGETKKLDASLRYRFNRKSEITFSGGHNQGEGKILSNTVSMNRENQFSYLMFKYQYSRLGIQLFWNRFYGDMYGQPDLSTIFHENTYDVESQYLVNLGSFNSIVMGVNYRLNLGESDVIIRQIEQSLYAFYLEDELRLRQNLALTLGFRYDGHSLFEDRITPRGNIMFSPRRKHFLRFSYAQAFRNPTFAETYLYIEGNAGPDDPSGLPPDISAFKVVGNQELEPEKITSYEAGYEALFANKIKCKIDLFYNHLTDFITLQMGPPPPPDDSMPPSPSDPISEENVVTFVNQGEASARGYELSLDLLAARWLRGWANYSYQYITEEDDDLHAPERDQTERMKAYPMHKFNVGFRFEPKRHFYANLMIHYVSQTEWDQNFLSQGQKLDSYTLFNLNVNYRIRPGKIESHLSAFNLFNDRHFEYPGNQGDQNSEPGFPSEGHLIGRRITFGISVNF